MAVNELRAGARVSGTDGELGTVYALVIDPTARCITHLVVGRDDPRSRWLPSPAADLGRRHLVTVDRVRSSSPAGVALDLDATALDRCEPFDEPDFNEPGAGYGSATLGYEPGALFLEPFASPIDGWALAQHERIPKGQITIRRGDEVVAADETHVGHVDELLVDPSDGDITHVVLREGNLFKRRDVVVPVAGARFEEGRIVLGLGVDELDALERIPVRRHGHVQVS